MPSSLKQASEVALSLPLQERAALAHTLIQSLEQQVDPDIEQAWNDEIEMRIKRIESGQTSERNAFEVLDEVRAKYGKIG